MIKAAIFDLDGTLMDTEVLWVSAVEQYLNDQGHAISYEEALAIVYGHSWTSIYDDIINRFPEIDQTSEEMEEVLRIYMNDMQNGNDMIIEGSHRLLKRLSGEMPVCIVSGSPVQDIETAVNRMDIASEIKFVLGAEDYAIGKPDPMCFLLAAEKLGVFPKECVVFEDSSAGIQAAKAAGMKCVALVRPGVPEQDVSGADLVVDDLAYFDPAILL